VFGAAAAIVVIVDQLSKAWIAASFDLRPVPIVGDLLRISLSHNTGGIFGLFGGSAAVLAIASTVVIGLIVVYQWRTASEGPWLLNLALGLLLGGAIGNLVDRIRWGYVLDFVDFGFGELRWYTFNVADAAISTSLVLLIAVSLLGSRLPRRLQ
jgi:signal peptidase II